MKHSKLQRPDSTGMLGWGGIVNIKVIYIIQFVMSLYIRNHVQSKPVIANLFLTLWTLKEVIIRRDECI